MALLLALVFLLAARIIAVGPVTPDEFAELAIVLSLAILLLVYVLFSRYENSYVNVLTPNVLVAIPAYYFLELVYIYWFGADATPYAFGYVYATLALEAIAFLVAYRLMSSAKIGRGYTPSYRNFTIAGVMSLFIAAAFHAPLLIKFRDSLTDPRRIYDLSRTGGGAPFAFSATLAYLAVILILFSPSSWRIKGAVTAGAALILFLHGSKGLLLSFVLLLFLYWVYVKGHRIGLRQAAIAFSVVAVLLVGSFASTMFLGESPLEALEAITQYSDYTRNAMRVIDSGMRPQFGRLTFEANVYAFVPRALSPNKPNDFGPFYLDAEFFPELMNEEGGLPDFGIGVQYADFGWAAAIYLALFSLLRGALAGIFVQRLKFAKHPADFFMVAFLADISLFSVGVGWLLPEALLIYFVIRWVSGWGTPSISPISQSINPAYRVS